MNKQHGFTIIETLVYLGLFAIVMTGIISVAYGIFESSGRNQAKVMVQTEGNFILGKINWAMTGATSTSVTWPNLGATDSVLQVSKTGVPDPLCIRLNTGKVQMKTGSICSSTTGYTDLNNSNITVSSLFFARKGSVSGTESIEASTTLQTLTPNGATYTQTFTTTKYLRK